MIRESPLAATPSYASAALTEYHGARLAAHFGDPAREYAAAKTTAAVFDRSDRGLVRVTGKDRRTWLHNLVTNAVKPLEAGQGAYAFACDVQGRIQFDLHILALPDELWLGIQAAAIEPALKHLDRLLITEDVHLQDVSGSFATLAVCGPRATAIAQGLGTSDFSAMPSMSHVVLESGARLVKNSFAGAELPAFELIVPSALATLQWQTLVDAGATPAGTAALEALRIEAGIPALGPDLEGALPAGTGQTERAVNYHKGCYLGQEVIERMRSRGALARRLARVCVPEGVGLAVPTPLMQAEREVGRLTSLTQHPASGEWIGLGYLRTSIQGSSGISAGTPPRAVELLS